MEMNLTFSGKRRRILQTLLMGLLCCMLTLPARAQDRVTVSGRLVDSGQNPLIGASVIEQGTTNGVTTDVEGRYEISVPGDAVLEYSYIGYKTQDVPELLCPFRSVQSGKHTYLGGPEGQVLGEHECPAGK